MLKPQPLVANSQSTVAASRDCHEIIIDGNLFKDFKF